MNDGIKIEKVILNLRKLFNLISSIQDLEEFKRILNNPSGGIQSEAMQILVNGKKSSYDYSYINGWKKTFQQYCFYCAGKGEEVTNYKPRSSTACRECGGSGWISEHLNHNDQRRGSGKIKIEIEIIGKKDCYYINKTELIVKPSSGCFITTAVLLALGKSDNCEELNVFRVYRDKYLNKFHLDSVTEYYQIAPIICDKINNKKNSMMIYKSIWTDYLELCFKLIVEKKNIKAFVLYSDMVKCLIKKYM